MSKLNRREFKELLTEWKQNFINEDLYGVKKGIKLYSVQATRNKAGVDDKFKNGIKQEHYTVGRGSIQPGFWVWRKPSSTLNHSKNDDIIIRGGAKILELSCDDPSSLIPDIEVLIAEYGPVVGERILYQIIKDIYMKNKSSLIGASINSKKDGYKEISCTINSINNLRDANNQKIQHTMQFKCDNNNVTFFNTEKIKRADMQQSRYSWDESNPKPLGTPVIDATPNNVQSFAYGLIEYAIKNNTYNNYIDKNFNKFRAYCYVGDPSNLKIENILTDEEFKSKHGL